MHRLTQQYSVKRSPSSDMKRQNVNAPSSSLSTDPSWNVVSAKEKLTTAIIRVPLVAFQAAVSIIITCIMIFPLNQSQYCLKRRPTVPLANETPVELDGWQLLPSDMTTLLSVPLVVLCWIAASWASRLCWHVICLLAKSHRVQRRGIRWASSRGALHPSTYIRHPLALVLGILLVSGRTQAYSPRLTDSIMRGLIASHLDRIPIHLQPTVDITADDIVDPTSDTDIPMIFAYNYMTRWETINKWRAVASNARLSTNSAPANVTMPYLHTAGEYQIIPSHMKQWLTLYETLYNKGTTKTDTVSISMASQSGCICICITWCN
ncbi:unnamed protein product [Rhizoctonia solani]|uniref:Uncharacterized protein n=1 Tax=Rhizoctonia solani TaxID=456999 RepID=A0A8H3E021_9AGAM|nr:unnamed protein product [Rhizoctonia solani]